MKSCKDIFIVGAIHELPLPSGLSFHLEDKMGLQRGETDILSVRSATLFLLTETMSGVATAGQGRIVRLIPPTAGRATMAQTGMSNLPK